MNTVLALHAGPGSTLPKPAVAQAHLVEGKGVEGDRHFGRHPDRAVLIAGQASYAKARQAGIELPWGALGENLLVDFDPHALSPQSRLKIGGAALELTQVCTVCDTLSAFDLRLPKLLYNARGVYAKVLQSGLVRVGDPVEVLTPDSLLRMG
ncbi:MOSC domain-containing protein [Meiothermus sp.]|uniref:MOSC domain-containing protein n=1 Tax=Meiothermus sp. TaxID=1955249 RepID=UPI00307E5744